MQRVAMLGGVARDDLRIEPIGLAASAEALGIEVHVAGVEHVDGVAVLMGQIGQQQVVRAGGLHGDHRGARQLLEPRVDGDRLVV